MKFPYKSAFAIAVCAAVVASIWLRTDESRPKTGRVTTDAGPVVDHQAIRVKWAALTDFNVDRHKRLELARTIRPELPQAEVDFLFDLMRHDPAPIDQKKWWVVINEVMYQMRLHGVGAEQYSDRLMAIIRDTGNHPVLREYAIQQLSHWTNPLRPDLMLGEKDPAKMAEATATIVSVVKDPSLAMGSVPATGLLLLADRFPQLSPQAGSELQAELQPLLENIMTGRQQAGNPLRTAAIQFAARSGQKQYLEFIRPLAMAESINPAVKLTAISALGLYAQPEDEAVLKSIAAADIRFRAAAQSALQEMTPGLR